MPISALLVSASLVAFDLRCEALTNPLAIQATRPELSWKLRPVRYGGVNLRQSAYSVLVASSPAKLAANQGDLWNSGRVASSATFGVRYGGKPLTSRQHAWWKVRIWDEKGRASAWSESANFATGLQKNSDWSAKWVYGNKPVPVPEVLGNAKWIQSAAHPVGQVPAGESTYTKRFSGVGGPVKLFLTADNTFVVRLNGKEVARTTDPEGWRKPVEVTNQFDLRRDGNVLEVVVNNAERGPSGLIAKMDLYDGSGSRREFLTDSSWECDGKPAKEIGVNGVSPWGPLNAGQIVRAPAQYFERNFKLAKRVKRATAYVTALGIVDFEVNGQRVTEDLFIPGWTNYRKRVHYRAFDVTSFLKTGENRLAAVLGQGWFAGYVAWGMQREHYGSTPMLKAQVELEFTDGTRQTVGTDERWNFREGPIRDEHFLHGEAYDATFKPRKWSGVRIGNYATKIEAFPGNPVRPYQTVRMKSYKQWSPGYTLIDFGQNLSGFIRLRVNQRKGTKITIRYGERLDENGRLYTKNLRQARAVDRYISGGTGVETWSPRFTFHGFRYAEVTGVVHMFDISGIRAVAISSSTPETGSLVTSDPMLNKLVKNAWWTQKMNFIDVPTDCPQRDERLGWTGDAQAYVQTASYFSDVQAFFRKWGETLDDDQRADGQYPKVAPVLAGLDDGGPAWSDAGVICPMTIYDMYGDRAMLAKHYPNMKRFIEFCLKRSKPSLLPPDQYHAFGDWLSIGANTPNDVITTAYFAGSTALVARAARILGHTEDAERYEALHQRIRKAFQSAYVSADGKVQGETQCSFVLALAFDLLEPKQAKLAADLLVADIEKRGGHLSTGFVGTRDLMQVLSKIGRNDVAFRLLHNTTFPSWGFTIVNGATSIWERWDGWTPEKGYQDPGMNSFAHYAYGAVAGWMFQTIGGITPLEPGFGRVRIAPVFDPKLSWADAKLNSVRGKIRCSWRRNGRTVSVKVEVPPSVVAEVLVPQRDGTTARHMMGSGSATFTSK